MKIDQIAFYAPTDEHADQIKAQFGLIGANWIKDTVTAKSYVYDGPAAINVAELQFNYDLGIELEILRYIEGPNWHTSNPVRSMSLKPFISHVGIHLADRDDFPAMQHCKLVQETFTQKHTSEYLTTGAGAGRKYHYRIFEMSPGSYIKYIRRLYNTEGR